VLAGAGLWGGLHNPLTAFPVIAVLGPGCGAVFGAAVARRRRARGLYAMGPWINAYCCGTSALLGVIGGCCLGAVLMYVLWASR